MPRPSNAGLDSKRQEVISRVVAGEKASAILSWLETEGITISDATFKRRLKEWREEKALPPGRQKSTDDDVTKAVLQYVQNRKRKELPTDEEIQDALKPRDFQISCRQIKAIRLRHDVRRRDRAEHFISSEELVAAVLLRCSEPTGFPKDDELAQEMNSAGFNTSEKEIFSIRLKHKIKHPCRGANRHGRRRGVRHETPSSPDDSESDDEEVDFPPPACKLVQACHFTIIDLEPDAVVMIHQIAPAISKLTYDKVRSGVRTAREPRRVAELAADVLNLLNVPLCTVTSMYISNHYIVPDALFGVWVMPLQFHYEREKIDDDIVNDYDEPDEHYMDDTVIKIGQAIYLSKQAAVHTRMTALILSR
ncbi:hypothetical protein H2198_006083 [Neophaeococcomyces mojaviensis]|uniref:Uncharacterized protein n=1 Tax=Neophaeococcomyces mojaviensis TaxID=3383035 RepID=A0ACC3A3X1_9EURO|nr:hypothetical protein H2198_006083 [Knufia sp. JES_112]